jgi:hypothetical protein
MSNRLARDDGKEESEKANHVAAQKALWEWALQLRIKLQAPLTIANRLPQPETRPVYQPPTHSHLPYLTLFNISHSILMCSIIMEYSYL